MSISSIQLYQVQIAVLLDVGDREARTLVAARGGSAPLQFSAPSINHHSLIRGVFLYNLAVNFISLSTSACYAQP